MPPLTVSRQLAGVGTSLYKALRRDGENSRLSLAAFGGTLLLAAGLLDATVVLTLVESGDDLRPDSIQVLSAIYENDFVPMAAGAMLVSFSSGLAIVRTGVLPKWLGWVAILLGVATVTPAGFVGFLGTGVWIAVVGIVLTLRGGGAAQGAAA